MEDGTIITPEFDEAFESVEAAIDEIEQKLEGMKRDKETKCKAAKEQLIEMLSITSDKYLTATGTAEALRVLRFVSGKENISQIRDANKLAHEMADEALAMATVANELDYAEMDTICKGFYNEAFVVEGFNESEEYELAYEMMRIDLCRNVGGAAEDMVSFIKRVQEEIDAMEEELAKLKEEQE